MNRITAHLPAIAMSLVVTVSLLAGIDNLATGQHAGTTLANAAQQTHTVAAKATAPRS